ncbi:Ig-like domain repeat protein [Nocardioides hungaricus]
MHTFTRALGALAAATLVAGGVTVTAATPAQARPAEAGLLDLPLPAPDQLPQLSGVPIVGQVLSVTQPSWNLLPGQLLSTDITWLCNGSPIPGTEGVWSFVPTQAQEGCAITAEVVTTVAGFLPLEMITNALQIPVVGESAVTPAAAPTVTSLAGTPKVGTKLTTSAPQWNQEGVATSYAWLRDGQPIAGQTAQTYTLVPADLDQAISVRATGRKDGLTDGVVTSNAVTAVIGDAPTPTMQPTISGSGAIGKALTVNPGVWGLGEVPAYAYQWRRGDQAIAGATAATYTPTTEDVGRVLSVTVTATRPGYRPGSFRTAGVSVPKLVSTLTASLPRKTVKQGKRAGLKLVLTVPGITGAGGPVTIYDGAKVLKRVRIANGRATVRLGKLKPGVHRLKAAYAGSDLATATTSKVVKLKVKKATRRK